MPTGPTRRIDWASAPGRPGWAKLDWLVGDRTRGILANASNVIDPTWEAPDGTIVPLDGFLDPYFQEVYLEAESIPLFTRLVADIGADAVDDYVEQLEHEVWKYTVVDAQPRQGRAPDVQRLPAVGSVPGGGVPAGAVRRAGDGAVPARGAAPDGRGCRVHGQRGVRPADCCWPRWTSSSCPPSRRSTGPTRRSWSSGCSASGGRSRVTTCDEAEPDGEDMSAARAAALAEVDDYFRRVLRAVPSIAAYLDELAARPA